MTSYASAADLYTVGLPPGSLSFPSRLVSSADATGDTIEINGHNLAADAVLQFTVDDDGVLPAPLAVATIYYAKPVAGSDSLLQIAASAGGAAISLTTAGTAPFRLARSIAGAISAEGEQHSRWLDSIIIGHEVPLSAPYPAEATRIVAKRMARSLVRMLGLGGLQHIIDEADSMDLDLLRRSRNGGVSFRDAAATAGANLATGASPTAEGRWGSTSEDEGLVVP